MKQFESAIEKNLYCDDENNKFFVKYNFSKHCNISWIIMILNYPKKLSTIC